MKPVFSALLSRDGGNNALAFLLASIVAGAVAALLLCPMESTRIKIVTDGDYADKNLLTALTKLTDEEGFGSIFAGLWAMLAKQVPYTFGKQVSFDVFAGLLYATYHRLEGKMSMGGAEVKFLVSVISAFLASLVACIFSQPGDMILTETYRPAEKISQVESVVSTTQEQPASATELPAAATMETQGDPGETTAVLEPQAENQVLQEPQAVSTASNIESRKFVDVVNRLYAEGGFPKFFTGTQARILHVGLIITSQLVIYDIVKQLLGLPATGSH
jgi:solute carrier family 25 (mitochondrial phosphate transporter), member 3